MTKPVMATGLWRNNAELIRDVSRLGYLDGNVLDVTYGKGGFWTEWMPQLLVGCDIDPDKSPIGYSIDFTNLPFDDHEYDTVVFDPPYKLNGTPDKTIDERYGVHTPTKWQDRMRLIKSGAVECARVARRFLLVKCQDQVCSGKVRWQTRMVEDAVVGPWLPDRNSGLWRLRDRFDILSYRAQPPGQRQLHARRNSSTLLVFERNRQHQG